MQDKAPVILNRSTHIDRLRCNLDIVGADIHVQQDFAKLQLQRPVDHHAQCTVLVMFTYISGGVVKIGIFQIWHCDQEVIAEGSWIRHVSSISRVLPGCKLSHGKSALSDKVFSGFSGDYWWRIPRCG